jgi:heme/copper-type cytochrome/quinol oxidase subunit 3
MLIWVMCLPRWEPAERPPHRPYYNVLIYWYFLTILWLACVAILYIGPNVYNAL